MEELILSAAERFGLPVALVVFFVIQSVKREAKRDETERQMREFAQESLVTLVEKTTTSIEQNTSCMDRLCKHLEGGKDENPTS